MNSGDSVNFGSGNVVSDGGNSGLSSDVIVSEENRVSGDSFVASSVTGTPRGSDEGKSVNFVGSEAIRVSAELENRAPESDVDSRVLVGGVSNLEISGSGGDRASEVDWKGISEEMRTGDSDTRNESMAERVNRHNFGDQDSAKGSRLEKDGANSGEKGLVTVTPSGSGSEGDVWNGAVGHPGLRAGKGHVETGKSSASQYESMILKFDEFASSGKVKSVGDGLTKSARCGLEVGDMVWGKVKSHPWWPGHIYDEAFASPSVRWTKKHDHPDHVLVAFFGDNSYGWFDPAELIPFDTHFTEKSRQSTTRTFVKAVEEAVDELSRRRGLGLACRCRNPHNFRPTNVEGYVAVDVVDYEPGGVYSENQIRKARDGFKPRDALAFMKQLALRPGDGGQEKIEYIKNKSTVLAYRRAVFEEFDETYAQAFGQQPVRPTRGPIEAVTQAARAPLTGPLVIAENLGKKKNVTKSNKVKDQTNKDRYLFKRRDEPAEVKTLGQADSSMQPAYVEGSVELAAGDYVLQKRASAVPIRQGPEKFEQAGVTRTDGSLASSRYVTGEEVECTEGKPGVSGRKVEPPANFTDGFPVGPGSEPKSSFDKGKGAVLEAKYPAGYKAMADPTITNSSGVSGKAVFHGGIDDLSHTSEEGGEGFQQHPSLAATVEVHGQDQVHSSGSGGHVLPAIDAKSHGQDSRETVAKKAKLKKRPDGEFVDEKSVSGEKKKKKRKRELGMEMASDHMQKRAAIEKVGASMGRVTGKSVQSSLPPREHLQIQHQKKDDGNNSLMLHSSVGTRQVVGAGNFELKLRQLLGDLQALALNPFHGVERNCPAMTQQSFLRFRSQVYQKSLALSTPAEMESNEAHVPVSPAGSTAGTDNAPREIMKDLPTSTRPPKPLVRSEDPKKGGRKRSLSDRQEELAAKRSKKVNDTRLLAMEKKAAQRTQEPQRDGKDTVAPRLPRPPKADSVKKMEPPLKKPPEPTVLTMRFPPHTSLPSGSELKARLARFGPLDHSYTRVFWKSSTCKVVFLHRAHAEAAHRHLTGNNTLFGNVNMRCYIRPLEASGPESESKVQREDDPVETLQLRDSAAEQRHPPLLPAVAAAAAAPVQQPVVQLKSCLKKPAGDEAPGAAAAAASGGGSSSSSNNNGGSTRVTPRVKFMLGGGESSRGGEQLMVGHRTNLNQASFADGGGATASHGMEINSKNIQRVIPPPASSFLPPVTPHPHVSSNAQINMRFAEPAPRNSNFNTTNMAPVGPSYSSSNVDIAQQMLSLLASCNEVVSSVKSYLGYVPYHPL